MYDLFMKSKVGLVLVIFYLAIITVTSFIYSSCSQYAYPLYCDLLLIPVFPWALFVPNFLGNVLYMYIIFAIINSTILYLVVAVISKLIRNEK